VPCHRRYGLAWKRKSNAFTEAIGRATKSVVTDGSTQTIHGQKMARGFFFFAEA
jgi:hypothetical protein